MRAYAFVKTKNHPQSWVIKYTDIEDDSVATFDNIDTPDFKLRWEKTDLDAYEYLKTLSSKNLFSHSDIVIDTKRVKWVVEINSYQPYVILHEYNGERQMISTIDGRPSIFCPIEYFKFK